MRRSARLKAQEPRVDENGSVVNPLPNPASIEYGETMSTRGLTLTDHLRGGSDADDISAITTEDMGRTNSSEVTKPARKKKSFLMDEVMEYIMSPITPEDRRNWKGWCELESEPVGIFVLSSSLV